MRHLVFFRFLSQDIWSGEAAAPCCFQEEAQQADGT